MAIELVGIKFISTSKIYRFDTNGIDLNIGERCIVETERGEELGTVVLGYSRMQHIPAGSKIYKKVVRKATDEDCEIYKRKAGREREAEDYCLGKIRERKLNMKLVNTELSSDGKKITFYFTADERVDFRELVKDIAQRFRTRIEMRQIGVRDEARVLGGYGACGRPLCCTTFLLQFEPVSIKMAKNQSLSLNPSKISGLCGRLMCCLRYECEGLASEKRTNIRKPESHNAGASEDEPTSEENSAVSFHQEDIHPPDKETGSEHTGPKPDDNTQ